MRSSGVPRVVPAALAAVVLAALLTAAGCAGREGARRFKQAFKEDGTGTPKALWEDSKEYLSRTENLVLLLAGGAASGAVRCAYDEKIDDHFQKRGYTFPRDLDIAFGVVPAAEVGLAAVGYLAGAWQDDPELYRTSRVLLEAEALNGIYTMLLKLAAHDMCPNGENLAWPSGHTSMAVTFAAVIDELWGPWIGWPLYGLSGLVAWQRIDTREHWASDIVFGAVLGYTVGKTVAGRYQPQVLGLDVLPYADPATGAAGIAFAKRF